MTTNNPWSTVTVGDIAKRSALTWLHEVQEHEGLMRQPINLWPDKTYDLACHIQQAINCAIYVAAGNGEGI